MLLKKASIDDLAALHNICVEAYSLHFHTHWEEGGLDWYLEREFSLEKLRTDVLDPSTAYYFIAKEEEVLGFIKIQENALLDCPAHEAMELVKMYILPTYKGQGIGKWALGEMVNKAREMGKKIFFLSVIDTNLSAIAFYEKVGFKHHSKTRLDLPYFKDELRGMNRMYMEFL